MADNKKVAVITGASSGIGEACAKEMLKRGWTVYGLARRVEKMENLANVGLKPIHVDITSSESRQSAIGTILEEEGRIDALVNNAGYGSYGSIEEVPLDEARRQFEVNLFGMAGMCQDVLPSMRLKGKGRIVNISSMGGRIYTPLGGWYFATKHAVEALSDALRNEVRPFGIKVSIIQPGIILSEWSHHSIDSLENISQNGPYQEMCKKVSKVMRFGYRKQLAGSPEAIADLVAQALTSPNPKIRYAGPWDAKLLLFFRKYAPDWLFDAVVRLVTRP